MEDKKPDELNETLERLAAIEERLGLQKDNRTERKKLDDRLSQRKRH